MGKMLFALIWLPFFVNATPSDGIRENETLIGYNDTFYYSIKTVKYPTGLYYKFIDSTFVMERSLSDGKLITKLCIQAATHIDKTTEGDWIKTEYRNEQFDYPQYLLDKKIKYLYPERFQNIYNPSVRLDILYEGLTLQLKNYKVVLLDVHDMEAYAPWVKKFLELEKEYKSKYPKEKFDFVTVKSFVSDDKHTFFIIRAKVDVEIFESVLVMDTSRFNLLQEEIEE